MLCVHMYYHLEAPDVLLTALPIATLETSLKANYDRRTRDTGRTDKATYRGTSYRSAQKETINLEVKPL